MNRLGFCILSVLEQNNAVSNLNGMTLKEITESEDFNCKDNTVYKQILYFKENGYIGYGVKDGRALTYFITNLGLEILSNERSAQ